VISEDLNAYVLFDPFDREIFVHKENVLCRRACIPFDQVLYRCEIVMPSVSHGSIDE